VKVGVVVARWIAETQLEVAEFFGVATNTIKDGWVSRGCPLNKIEVDGATGYDLSEITRWRLKYLMAKKQPTEEEALLDAAGPDAEHWKTEWTRNRALLAGEELGKVTRALVSIDEIAPTLRRAGVILADGIRRLEAEFGSDAADIVRTPLERMREDLETLIDSDDGNIGED
jgi:hypothetical protein